MTIATVPARENRLTATFDSDLRYFERALATLTGRRLALSLRNPRAILLPLATPVLIAVVIAPALAKAAGHINGIDYMTYVAIGTAALVVPLSCMQAGLGVIVDRKSGAQPDLLAAPVPRPLLVLANLAAALVASGLQLAALMVFSALRGASFQVSAAGLIWFVAAALGLTVAMYGIAETLANRIGEEEEYVNAIPTLGIAPWFFAGALFPISFLPAWLADVAKVLPATQAVALMRYGLVDPHAADLHTIWGMSDPHVMAALSLAVLVAYAVVFLTVGIRAFTHRAVK
jgi:ABC-type polysaccharide/polyol phosphate export permease